MSAPIKTSKPLTIGELVDKLAALPREGRVLFEVKGSSWAEITDVRLEVLEKTPSQYCEDDCYEPEELDEINKLRAREVFLELPRAVLLTDENEQVHHLATAVEALVEAAPDKKKAIWLKSDAGLFMTPDDLDAISDSWEDAKP